MIWCVVFNPAVDISYEVDQLDPLPAIQYAETALYQAGGKGHNVARAVAALGGAASVAGLYGGATGRWIRRELERLGIPVLAQGISGPNRICLTVADRNGRQAELRERGPTVRAADADALLQRLAARLQPEDWLVVSGGLPPGLPPSLIGDVVRAFTGRVQGVLVDTSGKALVEAWAARPFVLTPNREEFRALDRIYTPDGGPDHLLVTLGADGVTWRKRGAEFLTKSAPAVTLKSTTGAGDAFLAGLVKALDDGCPMAEAVDWGMAVAAASVQEVGVAVFRSEEVDRLVADLRTRRWHSTEGFPAPSRLDPG